MHVSVSDLESQVWDGLRWSHQTCTAWAGLCALGSSWTSRIGNRLHLRKTTKEVVSFKLTDAEVGETPTEQNQQKMQGLQMRRNQGLVLSLLESTSPRKDQKSIEKFVILRMWWDYTPHSFDCVFFKHFNLVFVVFGHSLWHRENLSPARGIRVSDGDRCSALFQRVSWPFKMPEWQGEHPPGLLFFFQHMNLDTLW